MYWDAWIWSETRAESQPTDAPFHYDYLGHRKSNVEAHVSLRYNGSICFFSGTPIIQLVYYYTPVPTSIESLKRLIDKFMAALLFLYIDGLMLYLLTPWYPCKVKWQVGSSGSTLISWAALAISEGCIFTYRQWLWLFIGHQFEAFPTWTSILLITDRWESGANTCDRRILKQFLPFWSPVRQDIRRNAWP